MHSTFHKAERFVAYICACLASLYVFDTSANGGHPGEFNLKTNLLQDAVGTMSLGAEYRFSNKFSLDVMGAWNPWTFSDHMMYRQWSVSPQMRWWPGQKGHFLGFSLIGGEFNYNKVSFPFNAYPELRDYRYEGWMLGGGISYGYRYDVSKRFALEATIGVGLAHVAYDKYICDRCGENVASGNHLYFGPMRTGFNLIYRIGSEPTVTAKVEEIPVREPIIEVKEEAAEVKEKIIEKKVETIIHDTIYIKEYIPVNATNELSKIRHASFALRLNYPVSSSQIIADYGNNRAQLDSLKKFINEYISDSDLNVISIDVNGYASVEGTAAYNLELSQRRARSVADLIEWMYPGVRRILSVHGLGEDWDSLNFDGKESLLRINDLDLRENELRRRKGERFFDGLLLTQFPDTRRVECVINYTIEE